MIKVYTGQNCPNCGSRNVAYDKAELCETFVAQVAKCKDCNIIFTQESPIEFVLATIDGNPISIGLGEKCFKFRK